MRKKGLMLWGLLLIMLVLTGCSQNDKYISAVKNGHPTNYPAVEIGQAFDKFFANPQWKHFKSDKDEEVVEFTGKCKYLEVEVTAKLQFVFNDAKNFEVKFLAFNDVPQNMLVMGALLSKVYESAGDKGIAEAKKNTANANIPSNIQLAQNVLNGKGVQGNVIATSYKNKDAGFLSLSRINDQYNIIVYDSASGMVASVPFKKEQMQFIDNKNKNYSPPLIFKMNVLNDSHDKDEKNGVWNGNDHMIPIYALYSFDANGKVVPGRLTTGYGANPSHYQGYLMEQKNVDLANLFLTEMAALRSNCNENNVVLP